MELNIVSYTEQSITTLTDLDMTGFKEAFIDKVEKMHGKPVENTSTSERYKALAGLVRDYIGKQWVEGAAAVPQG